MWYVYIKEMAEISRIAVDTLPIKRKRRAGYAVRFTVVLMALALAIISQKRVKSSIGMRGRKTTSRAW